SYDTCDAAQNINDARDYLSELVTLTDVQVVNRYLTVPTTGFSVAGDGPSFPDSMFVENQNNVLGTFATNNPNYPAFGTLCNITGVVHYTTNTSSPSYRVCPRTAADIQILGPAGVTPSTLKLSFSVFPSPARSVNVAFTLPHAGDVRLGVFDLFGRRITTLAQGQMAAGAYSKAWAGVDDAGRHVKPGMYFYRLDVGGKVLTTRSLLLN
ncbi:MAG TPA: FlgD immunoglobulin-like domain containing protein, partial [Candidatus Acidoferrales bacterium]|nr:FlgD immunoglobulin-like domain containing protein [Candidatus Acidoferrales bacterium]